MADIYLVGHGSWDTRGRSDAFTTVPSGTRVVFYTPIGRYLDASIAEGIIRNAHWQLGPYEEFGEYRHCPNVMLFDVSYPNLMAALVQSGVRFGRVSMPTPLSSLLEKYAGNTLHWIACSGRLGGNDLDQHGLNFDYIPGIPDPDSEYIDSRLYGKMP